MDFLGQLSPSQTTSLLKDLNHFPNKKLGQNFLIDSNIVRKSLALSDIKDGDYVVEVGPGLGTLSGALLEKNVNLFAVELDKRLYAHLCETFPNSKFRNFNLINEDALDFPLAALPGNVTNFKVVANLPYAISTPWIDAAISYKAPSKMVLMLQKEAAVRFTAKEQSSQYCPISIFINLAYEIFEMHKVSANCFYPKPKVDSLLLALEIKKQPFFFKENTKLLIRKIFSQRRKQIGSIIKNLNDENASAIARRWLESENISTILRPDDISILQWKSLNNFL